MSPPAGNAMVPELELPRSKSRELELPTQIPISARARGDSGGSGSDATPLLGAKSGPPPPSPLAGSLGAAWAATADSPASARGAPPPLPGKAAAVVSPEWSSPGWSDPAMRDSVASTTSSGIGSLLPSVTSANSRSAENSEEEEDVDAESTVVAMPTALVPHPGLTTIASEGDLERIGLSATTSSEDEIPSAPGARRFSPPESPMLLRLKSEVAENSSSSSDDDEDDFDEPIVLVPEPEPEPEPEVPTRSMPPVPVGAGGSPQRSSQGTPMVNRDRARRGSTEDAAMAREAREARTQQLSRATQHVSSSRAMLSALRRSRVHAT